MTGKVLKLIPKTLLILGLVLVAASAYAKDNLCGECHTAAEIASFGDVMAWEKSIFQEKDTICPGVLELKKEAYFTESRLVKYDEFLEELEHETRRYSVFMMEDIDKNSVRFSDMARTVPTSIAAVAGPNMKIKKDIHAVYEKINKLRGDFKMEKAMGFGLLGTMIISLLMFMGLKNTIKE